MIQGNAPEPPPPGLEDYNDQPMGRVNLHSRQPGQGEAWFHGDRCEVALTAWYDSNGDRVVNAGDFVATYPRSTFTHSGSKFGTLVLERFKP